IPRNLEAIVFKALAKDPKDRYQDMRTLAADLAKFSDSGAGLGSTMSLVWSLYRSRRKRLNAREKIAMVATSIALVALLLCASTFAFFYFKGTQGVIEDREFTWLTAPHKSKLQSYYDPASHLVSFSLRA